MFDSKVDFKLLEYAVDAYEKQPIEKGKILFYGHSLFTRWNSGEWGNHRPLEDDIRMKDGSLACVNHGFGTSTSEELLYYYPRLVRPWDPRALVIATFANDAMYGCSVEDTMTNVSKICHWARTDFPGIKIFLVEDTVKLKDKAYDERELWNKEKHRRDKYNEMISFYAQTHDDTELIRFWDEPGFFETPEDVGNYKKIREDIFADDKVHFNQAGYDIVGRVFREALKDLL